MLLLDFIYHEHYLIDVFYSMSAFTKQERKQLPVTAAAFISDIQWSALQFSCSVTSFGGHIVAYWWCIAKTFMLKAFQRHSVWYQKINHDRALFSEAKVMLISARIIGVPPISTLSSLFSFKRLQSLFSSVWDSFLTARNPPHKNICEEHFSPTFNWLRCIFIR